jgi:hypothetical protein
LAVPNRVTALGGSRIVCGRALCRQSPNRRHSALELPVPRLSPTGRRHFSSRPAAGPGRLSPKIFLLCGAARVQRQVPDSTPVFCHLTGDNSFIRLHFSVISQRHHQPTAYRLQRAVSPRSRTGWQGGRSEPQRSGKPGTASPRTEFQGDNKLSSLPGGVGWLLVERARSSRAALSEWR